MLENLKPYTKYYTKVAAFNAAGIGPYTYPLDFVTEKARKHLKWEMEMNSKDKIRWT